MGGRALLKVQGLSVRFGGVTALDRLDLEVAEGSVHGLIGPNGAGKTTLLNAVSRLVDPQEGQIWFDGHNLLQQSPHRITQLGITRTFQNLGLIEHASTLENVLVGLHTRHAGTLFDDLVRFWRRNAIEGEMRLRATDMLRAVHLDHLAHQPVRGLTYGTRKNIELARACVGRPTLLMLDEPTAGLNASEMDRLRELLLLLRSEQGLTILIITHHVEFLLGVADVTTVLDLGRRIAHGSPGAVRNDPHVISAYIGTD